MGINWLKENSIKQSWDEQHLFPCLWNGASEGAGEEESADMSHLYPELVGSSEVRTCCPSLHPENMPICPVCRWHHCSSEDVDGSLVNLE